ncbi:MAG: UDP-N-acetylmuramoyl-tripeptide--D-alanyl-D-alanine ligase [Ignavibacteriales bacterium]|nr:UDP-N-acetylmuramoyl-tripeptide--D-alanyl-D-alanine ligase [Ignavibacteriaceae bacterium]QOJ29852.1 MAG: UDP-N-acetylmuramoyl-tripeptide--D-alanyl-D-alanine ligase [Ignavibacteriales bacterium]
MAKKTDIRIYGKEILNITGTELVSPADEYSIDTVSIDTRTLTAGSLYIALRGEKHDGHTFIQDAIAKGAAYIAVDRNYNLNAAPESSARYIVTDNTTAFLGSLARIRRNKLSATVIAITGSNGKTTTKDILSTLLGTRFRTVSTRANDNNHIGVPLTIFRCDAATQMLVLELGTNHFGEIPYTASIAQPDLALITVIGDSHLEYLKNRRGVLKEKEAIFTFTAARGGKVFLNLDDALLKGLVKKYKDAVTFSTSGKAAYTGRMLKQKKGFFSQAKITGKKLKAEFTMPLLGEHSLGNILAAAALAHSAGLPEAYILRGMRKVKPARSRLELIKTGNTVIIDDTYNANPNSMQAALRLLSSMESGAKKIAVLGDMFELGEQSVKLHTALAPVIRKLAIDEVILTGEQMRHLFKVIQDKKKNIIYFDNGEMLSSYLKSIRSEKALYLFKGSRGMRMEQFINPVTGA